MVARLDSGDTTAWACGHGASTRHPLASVATLVLGLRCSWCPESAPMPRILGLHALPPAAKAAASNLR
jgi:hypothetical protein